MGAVVDAFLLVGLFFGAVATVGILRFPDVYSRAHATSKSDTLGTSLTLAAVALLFDGSGPTVMALLLVAFVLLTNATAAHATVRAAAEQGVEPWAATDSDADADSDADPAGAPPGDGRGRG